MTHNAMLVQSVHCLNNTLVHHTYTIACLFGVSLLTFYTELLFLYSLFLMSLYVRHRSTQLFKVSQSIFTFCVHVMSIFSPIHHRWQGPYTLKVL